MKYIVMNSLKQHLAVFILGFLLGTVLTTLQVGSNIDSLSQKNSELKLELDNTLIELTELKEKNLAQGYIVTKIETEISILSENLTLTEVQRLKIPIAKEVTKHYKSLVGSKVNALNPTLLPKLIDGRLFKIDGKFYKILVKTMVISETLLLSIDVIPQ